MTYWFNTPETKDRMSKSSRVPRTSSSFYAPKIFVGTNFLPESGGGLPTQLAPLCPRKRAFIVCDPAITGLAEKVVKAMQGAQFATQVWDKAEPEVPLPNVKECAAAMNQFGPDLIIGVGGGSALDLAKAAWVLYERPDITDLSMLSSGTPLRVRRKAIMLAIPTTSGTGSECTGAAVLSDVNARRKIPISSRELIPDFALLDPTFPAGMPPKLTAGTGLDVLAHAIDSVMCTGVNDLTEPLSLRSIELAFKYLSRAYRSPEDQEARLKMHIRLFYGGDGVRELRSGPDP